MSDDLRVATEKIKLEDSKRELYTLVEASTETVKLPTFEGRDDEDFDQFKTEVEKAFVSDIVIKSAKLKKLREVLKGNALRLVPESTTNTIDDAWTVLGNAFGNPIKLMKYRKNVILKLGMLPKENVRGGPKAQVDWYIKVESLIQSIIDLGNKSEELGREAFNPSAIACILNMFPNHLLNKLNRCAGTGCVKLEAILAQIKVFRSEAQENQLVREVHFSSQNQAGASNWYDASPDQFHGVETDHYGYE